MIMEPRKGLCLWLMHVDDGLTLGPLEWLKQKYIPTLKTRFEISVEIAYRLGDTFLS